MTGHWDAVRRHWQLLGPPLKPPAEAVRNYAAILDIADADVLLLGVTPELATLGRNLVAVDAEPGMIAHIWPGDTPTRKAVVGSWFELPVASASVDAALGDGCVSVLASSAERRQLFSEIARVLRPGGRAALRGFSSRQAPEELAEVRARALAGRVSTFHELKWRVAMARAANDPGRAIMVRAIKEAFEATFPDRAELAAATGWDAATIGTIDVYANSDACYSFPTRDMLVEDARSAFHDFRIVESGAYPFAECCPFVVVRASV